MPAMATHWTLGGDANDPHVLAQFWAKALGYVAEPGYDDPDGASIIDPEGRVPRSGGFASLKGSRRRTGYTSTSARPVKDRRKWPSESD
jgi:hypothetical protein